MHTFPQALISGSPARVFEIRGYLVMLSSEVASIFDVETRHINQNIRENNKQRPPLFPEKYAFQLNEEETAFLRSSGVIPKLTRGGSRAAPWVITRKGAIRLATLMKGPKAIQAADLFVDIFDEVLTALIKNKQQVSLTRTSQLVPEPATIKEIQSIRNKISHAITDLLNTVIDKKENKTVRDEIGEIAEDALSHLKEWLKNKRLTNDRIKAETLLIIEQARDIYERRQSELATAELEREGKALENVDKKIALIERLLTMHNELEPNALVQLVSGFTTLDSLGDG